MSQMNGLRWWRNCRLSSLSLLATIVALAPCSLPAVAAGQTAAPRAPQGPATVAAPQQVLPARQAYRDVLTWASGNTDTEYLDELYDRIERAAYRYSIIPEFALAVVAAEAQYGGGISWARYDSWRLYELTTKTKLERYPAVLNDLDTALSELRLIMSNSNRVEDVFRTFWCGQDGKFNANSLAKFSEAASKLWNGLEIYARERTRAEDRNKYSPEYYGQPESDDPAWAGLAFGDMDSYASGLGSMPLLAKQLKSYGKDEADYVKVAKKYNKQLSDAEATVIIRAILTYCEKTEWRVDPRLVMAVVIAESSFRPNARSKVGALGLGQLMPATARGFGIKDPFDPIQNLYGTVKYLERELHRWRNSAHPIDLVLAAYNAGPGAVKRYKGVPPYKETRNYVQIVKRNYLRLAPEMKAKL